MSEQQQNTADFTGHEPVLHIEDEGLHVRGYEIESQFYLDFDWDPDSRWGFLDDEAAFRQFVENWLAEMTGEAMLEADLEQLEFLGNAAAEEPACAMPSGEDTAPDQDGKQGEPEEKA